MMYSISRYKGGRNDTKSTDWTILDAPKETSDSSSGARGWTDQEPRRNTNYSSSSSASSNSNSRTRDAPAADGTEAQKKFGSAKAISSDQFFQDSRDNDVSQLCNVWLLH
jgi:ADP-ribosylation factor GTPase-activating protein 2/3